VNLQSNASLCPNSEEGKKHFARVACILIVFNASEGIAITVIVLEVFLLVLFL
jgi:hypothetical protein